MKALIDINILLDVILRREPHFSQSKRIIVETRWTIFFMFSMSQGLQKHSLLNKKTWKNALISFEKIILDFFHFPLIFFQNSPWFFHESQIFVL